MLKRQWPNILEQPVTQFKPVTIKDVLSDDPTSPFWQRMLNSPDYERFAEDLDHIISESQRLGRPFNQIDPQDLAPHDWNIYGPTHG